MNEVNEANAQRWRAARPELIVSAVTVAAAAVAGAAVAGWPGVVIVAAVAAAVALVLLRAVIPFSAAQTLRLSRSKPRERVISGYQQRLFIVATSRTTRATYEADLRPVLEHILAARLAERHSVNLYTEPDAARRAFCRTGGEARLWAWIDPAQALEIDARTSSTQGIPARTLNQLITRLEQL
jgi:hypothetical protein